MKRHLPRRAVPLLLTISSTIVVGQNVYENSKTIPATCDAVWPAVVSAITKNGFTPTVSDHSGGILQAQSGATSKYRGAKKDMEAFTANRANFWTAPEAFMVVSAGVALTSSGNSCSTTVQVQYAALKTSFSESMANAVEDALTTCRICPKRPLAKNWIRLQSNGRLESMILSETEQLMRLNPAAQAPAPPVPSVSIVQDQVRQSEPRLANCTTSDEAMGGHVD